METLIVMPPLTMLIFIIVQFSLVWYAQIMTHYAAYNAARAALVYHPSEYRKSQGGKVLDEFKAREGACWQAAVLTLAPLSFSPSGGGSNLTLPVSMGALGSAGTSERLPNSSFVAKQVALVDVRDDNLDVEPCAESNGCVRVTVAFDFPMIVPVAGKMLAYFYYSLNPATDSASIKGEWQIWGDSPSPDKMRKTDAARAAHPMKVDYITLHAYCVLPKPYSTTLWALRPKSAADEALK